MKKRVGYIKSENIDRVEIQRAMKIFEASEDYKDAVMELTSAYNKDFVSTVKEDDGIAINVNAWDNSWNFQIKKYNEDSIPAEGLNYEGLSKAVKNISLPLSDKMKFRPPKTIKMRFQISWGNGGWTRREKEFKDEKHLENWKNFINKRGGVIKDEEKIW